MSTERVYDDCSKVVCLKNQDCLKCVQLHGFDFQCNFNVIENCLLCISGDDGLLGLAFIFAKMG